MGLLSFLKRLSAWPRFDTGADASGVDDVASKRILVFVDFSVEEPCTGDTQPTYWVRTRGMAINNLPELELYDVPGEYVLAAMDRLHDIVDYCLGNAAPFKAGEVVGVDEALEVALKYRLVDVSTEVRWGGNLDKAGTPALRLVLEAVDAEFTDTEHAHGVGIGADYHDATR